MQVTALLLLLAGAANAESCQAPARPFVPSDPRVARDYGDIIRSDFEIYFQDIQGYFRCLDDERARAFEEAREVSEEYGRFLEQVEQ
ncbi:hypothetical protein [Tropicimonas marinistellae]|uniref:hypothetical protein n=1 Tax=Tropicimonas marinistellae TaxID=1739787 RepID=UPI000830386B|nr:hypothetical protein [Tropicimonas marinistellae]